MDNQTAVTNYIARVTLDRIADLLKPEDERQSPEVMDLFMLPDRVVIALRPLAIRPAGIKQIINPGFARTLSASLQGRRVAPLAHGGLFLQVAYTPDENLFPQVALDLDEQPGPLHVPIGVRGEPVWRPLSRFAPAFVAGATGRGKSSLFHQYIISLLSGGECILYLYDGKRGVEFGHYDGQRNVRYFDDWDKLADELLVELDRRARILKAANFKSVEHFNEAHEPEHRLPVIALVVDEIAEVRDVDGMEAAVKFVTRGRYCGIYPLMGTQYPTKEIVSRQIMANMLTSICLLVGDSTASRVVIGSGGAEKLPQEIKGRFLMARGGVTLEVQAFYYVPPNGKALTAEQIAELEREPEPEPVDEFDEIPERVIKLAERIRYAWLRGAEDKELFKIGGINNAGRAHYDMLAAKEYLERINSTTTTDDDTHNDKNSAD